MGATKLVKRTPSTVSVRADRVTVGDLVIAGRSTERRVLSVTHMPRGYGDAAAPVEREATVIIRTTHDHYGQDDIRVSASDVLTIVSPIVRWARDERARPGARTIAGTCSPVPDAGDLGTFRGLYGPVPVRVASVDPVACTVTLTVTGRRSRVYAPGDTIADVSVNFLTLRRHNGRTITSGPAYASRFGYGA